MTRNFAAAEVTNLTYGDKAIFPCNAWLARNHGDGKIERTLFAEGFVPPVRSTWQVDVFTGGQAGSGTDARVELELVGRSGARAGPFKLDPPSTGPYSSTRQKFRPGTKETFSISSGSVGDLESIKVSPLVCIVFSSLVCSMPRATNLRARREDLARWVRRGLGLVCGPDQRS